jgi:hypothetical protein
MGVLFRGAIVVATIFAVSPMREGGLPQADEVKAAAASSAQRMTDAALALCGEDRTSCIARATEQIARILPRADGAPKRVEAPLPVPRPAAPVPR